MTDNMATELRHGVTGPATKVYTLEVRNRVMEFLSGAMVQAMRGTFSITTSMVRDGISGMMAAPMMAPGKITKCTVTVFSLTQMVIATKAITAMTRRMDLVSL